MNAKNEVYRAFKEERHKPFVWGVCDCRTWCGLVAKRLTGRDPLAEFDGQYSSEMDMRRILVWRGWKDVGDAAASVLPEIPVSHAQSGDWALCSDHLGNDGLGVVCGEKIAVRGPSGMWRQPLTSAKRAFKVI